MKCDQDDCFAESRFFIISNFQMVPMCQSCMIESLCSVPTQVINREAYEAVQRDTKQAS